MTSHGGIRARVHRLVPPLAAAVVLAGLVAGWGGRADGATSSVVVTATVPSATNLDVTGCPTGGAGTAFGAVLPGSSNVTTGDCSIVFGSSNDTAMLLAHQVDGLGVGMWRPPAGPLDTGGFGAASCPCTGTAIKAIQATRTDVATSVALQPDGKIVVAGYQMVSATDRGWFVSRFNADGTIDGGFGTGGTATINPTANDDRACCVVVLATGQVAVGGITNFTADGSPAAAMVWVTTSTGLTDNTFGGTGSVQVTPSAGRTTYTNALSVMPNGDLALSGAPSGLEVFTVMFRMDGSLDPAWDGQAGMAGGAPYPGNGIVVYNYFNGCGWTWASAAQPDGKLVVSGQSCAAGTAAIARMNADGSLDTTFAGSGIVNTNWGANGQMTALALQPDGKVVAVGPGGAEFHVERFLANGTPDGSFAAAGHASFNVGNTTGVSGACPINVYSNTAGAAACAVGLLPDGRIMVAGIAGVPGGTGVGYARLNANGSMDASFGTNGMQVQQVNAATKADTAYAMALGQDGHVITAGSSFTAATKEDVALTQLSSLPVLDYNAGSANWSVGANMFGACLNSIATGATTAVGPTPAATWQVNAGCPTSGTWNPIPATAAAPGAKVAQSTTSTTQTARANLRFGFRTATGQAPGTYLAPVQFDVVAPNV